MVTDDDMLTTMIEEYNNNLKNKGKPIFYYEIIIKPNKTND
jgi:hypothetical protein